jgi:hypothetical protein
MRWGDGRGCDSERHRNLCSRASSSCSLSGFGSCYGMIVRSICLLNATGFRYNLLTGFDSLERLCFVLTQKYHRNGLFQLGNGHHRMRTVHFQPSPRSERPAVRWPCFQLGHPCRPMFEQLLCAPSSRPPALPLKTDSKSTQNPKLRPRFAMSDGSLCKTADTYQSIPNPYTLG